MSFFQQQRMRRASQWLCVPLLLLTTSCESPLVHEAREAEGDGRVISNDLMKQMYPQAFREGDPPYLERDFEAGADFICDKIKLQYNRDICSEPAIGWR
ncbi:hypothetical protein [Tsuneonella mangrovi]|uniref:hypothetical protein n=1 Tax=Tsuneonella mangrovi TaxID=1982042 RepID=UPI0012374235|nr:hypothetical protein [Tsuneonella mangrovi]